MLVAAFVAGCGPADRVGHDIVTDEGAVRASGAAGRARGGSGGTPAAGASSMTAAAEGGSGAAGASGTAAAAGAHADAGDGAETAYAGAGGSAGASGMPANTAGMGGASSEAGGGRAGTPPTAGAAAGSGEPAGPVDPECDFNGVWIARLTTFSRDSVFSSVQTASNWFYYEIAHHGRDVMVTKALDCGFQVSGSAEITLTSATIRALLTANDQTGRRGEFYKDADHCALRIARWYSVRGVSRATYLPADIAKNPELETIQPALPTEQSPMGSEDWDQDGMPGIGINVSGLGSRHVVQRDWNEFWSDDASIALRASEFVARGRFDVDEQIMAVSGGLGALLRAGATPAADMRHRILFRRIATTPSDAAAGSVRVTDDDLETCYNVQESLPHDPVMQ